MKLFLNDLDDLHQWDFIHNQKVMDEIERLQGFARKIDEHRENWKRRALAAEAKLAETDRQLGEALLSANRQNVSEFRYAALRRYLAKQFHPDYAPGYGIEKVVRNEIFKEIWSEITKGWRPFHGPPLSDRGRLLARAAAGIRRGTPGPLTWKCACIRSRRQRAAEAKA